MKMRVKLKLKIVMMFMMGLVILMQPIDANGPKTINGVLKAMEEELNRYMKVLGEKGSPPPYFICYQITDKHQVSISAALGALKKSSKKHSRLKIDRLSRLYHLAAEKRGQPCQDKHHHASRVRQAHHPAPPAK